ncbi:Bax inhibitor-1/YccA family protein [Heyndrickxia ginsengihumi]|uniref:Bax inhibitor-1/YccA family protein n=1 Tax=Heyndrickxia ginsengihumi TaxID=363870 RepID=UPI0020418E05|nr:Bax inhibitor-1/YccA family protein [Heyndrickxia ginsengihumi]MCM3023856.1 Bax inhibitor-1/YccA family protein [Heyndrickxia ginsengihumi]
METIQVNQRSMFQKVLGTFIVSLLIATVGLYVGQYIPPIMMFPLAVLELILIISAFWIRKSKSVGYTFVYVFTFISGITTFPIVSHYVSIAGAQVVLLAFASTFGIFAVMGIIGAITKKDLSFLSTFLLVALLALVFISLFNIFSPLNSGGLLAFSAIGSIVFSLYIMYDFNQMKQHRISEEMVPLLALNLYLDFINLFTYILQLLGIIESDD